MNIFEVLTQGKSRLHEPSISAMIAYLLNPSADHGLRDTFLRAFLSQIDRKTNTNDFLDLMNRGKTQIDIMLEEPYNHEGRKDIDIQISIYDSFSYKEIERIIIENKIKVGAANPKQLKDYYNAVINDEDYKVNSPNLTVVFLTPDTVNRRLEEEFDNLIKEKNDSTKAIWLLWCSDSSDKSTIVTLVQDVLTKELQAKISPINEYMRQTLKAFVYYIDQNLNSSSNSGSRRGKDIGYIIEEQQFEIDNIAYKILRRDSTQIQLFESGSGQKISARPILRKFLNEHQIKSLEETNNLNTRQIGKILLESLK